MPGLWLLGAKLSGAPDAYFQELLFDQNIGRMAGEFGGHRRPFYYFFKYLPIDFLPWTVFLPVAILPIWPNADQRRLLFRLFAWIGFVVLFFSLSGSKRNLYILSVYPAASMIVAMGMPAISRVAGKWQAATAYLILGVIGILGVAGIATPWVKALDALKIAAWPFAVTGVICLIGALSLLRLGRRQRLSMTWFSAFIGFFVLLEIILGTLVMPAFNPIKTPVALADAARTTIPPGNPLITFRGTEEILSLYCDRQGLRIDNEERLIARMHQLRRGIVVFSAVVWPDLAPRFEKWGESHPLRVGNQNFVWLSFDEKNIPPGGAP